MPSTALDGASQYLNNLLLARGFLHDGKPIDFAQLAATTDEASDKFDRSATTTHLMNLVHDLVLRRDRDAEQREALAATIRALRNEESQRVLDLQRVQDKNAQLQHELSTSEGQQRTLTVSARKAQAETRELKEQMLKMKSTLDQVRAKCISDIRKRDVELDKLKNHFNGLNRGKKESSAGGMKINTINLQKKTTMNGSNNGQDNNVSEWTLENETNDFLAAVVNETSTENVALRKIVGDSMRYLRTLTGLDEQERRQQETAARSVAASSAIGIPGQYRDRAAESTSGAEAEALVPVQDLGSSMSQILAHCHTILRDPSFVPIEEVQARDEEIAKLRAGWEKMADRWKEAVTMMSQWRQQIAGPQGDQETSHPSMEIGQTHFDAEGLSGIAAFGRSVAMRPDGHPVLDPIEEEELTSMLMEHQSRLGNQSAISEQTEVRESEGMQDETLPEPDETGTPRQQPLHIPADEAVEESDLDISEKAPPRIIASPARRGIKLQKATSPSKGRRQPLSNTNANPKKRKSDATSSSPRKRRSVSPDIHPASTGSKASTRAPPATNSSMHDSVDTTDPLHLDTLTSSLSGNEEEDDPFAPEDLAPKESSSKLPRMTVAQKLAAVEAEAGEATEVIRRRQATTYSKDDRRARDRGSKVQPRVGEKETKRAVKPDSVKSSGKTSVKGPDRVKKARDRRRSTLTPAELGSLMGR